MKIIHILLYFAVLVLSPCSAFSQQWAELDTQYEILHKEKKYDEALSVAKIGIDIAGKQYSVKSKEYHKSLKNIAEAHMMLGLWEKANRYFKEVLRREIDRVAAIDVNMSTTIQSITGLYDLLHDQKTATGVYQKATQRLSQLQKIDNTIYTGLSDIYTQALMTQPPPTINQSFDLITKQTGIDLSTMKQTVQQYAPNLASGKHDKQLPATPDHEYEETIVELIDACAQNKRYSNFSGGINSCKKLYILRQKMGLEQSMEHASTCFDLGYFYMLSSKYLNSIEYYLEGVDLWEKNNFPQNQPYIEALYNVSASLQVTQQLGKAKELLEKAEKVTLKLKDEEDSLYPGILIMLAAIERQEGNYTDAEKSYDRYRDYYLHKNISDPAVWLNYYLGAGLVYEQLGKWDQADRVYLLYNKTTIDLISKLFRYVTLSSEKKVAQNFVGIRYNQDFFYSYCYKRKGQNPELIDQMYNNELASKGLVLRTLQKKTEMIFKSADPVVIGNYKEWLDVRQKVAKLSMLPVSDRKVDLDDLERRIKQLEDKLMSWMLSHRENETIGLHWGDVQNELLAEEAAIEFVKFQEFGLTNQKWTDKVLYGALIIRPDSPHPLFINLFEENEFQIFLRETGDPSPFEQVRKMYTWLPGQYGGIYKGDFLYNLVWKELEPYLKGVKKIYYSPTGLLHKISFDAIPVDEKKTLIQKYRLHRLSTTGLLADKYPDFYFTKRDQVLLFGGMLFDLDFEKQTADSSGQRGGNSELFIRDSSFDWTRNLSTHNSWPYLKGTLDEVEGIAALLQTNNIKYQTVTGEQGLEENFKLFSGNQQEIIHIATHGFFFPSDRVRKDKRLLGLQVNTQIDPGETFKRSGLLFTGANATWLGKKLPEGIEDGILTAHEISKLNLNKTKLVILSACETGLGDITSGEGVYGLQRAFKLAGVDNIIMSLWQVPDAQTAELMDILYSQWLEGKELREAFHTAQKRMSEKYEPYFWGAFMLLY